MLTNSRNWERLKSWANWTGRITRLEILATGAILPILECILVNKLTGAKEGEGWPFVVVLGALALLHVYLLRVAILREKGGQVLSAIDAIEAEEQLSSLRVEADQKVKELQSELQRRTHCYGMIRTAIDAFNFQTCQLDPSNPAAFGNGLEPIIQRVTCSIQTTLGVTSSEFTLEVVCYDWALDAPGSQPDGKAVLAYFFSSQRLDQHACFNLGNRAPWYWGLQRRASGTCYIEDDPKLFFQDGKPSPGLYFRIFATVPIPEVCSPNRGPRFDLDAGYAIRG